MSLFPSQFSIVHGTVKKRCGCLEAAEGTCLCLELENHFCLYLSDRLSCLHSQFGDYSLVILVGKNAACGLSPLHHDESHDVMIFHSMRTSLASFNFRHSPVSYRSQLCPITLSPPSERRWKLTVHGCDSPGAGWGPLTSALM
ncbi:hypothetical protein SRHO_G00053090 [Serrasalmus rhombeus]